jgi:hypothetical protein
MFFLLAVAAAVALRMLVAVALGRKLSTNLFICGMDL